MGTKTPKLDMAVQCCIWLVKNLCIDTNAEKASVEQEMTYLGKSIGTYRVTIEKIK